MPLTIEKCKRELDKLALAISVPMIILLIPLEALIDKDFICPCDAKLNPIITNLIFAGPFILVFASMCIILQQIKFKSSVFQPLKMLFLCLIPPFVWIVLVLLDGDYVACRDTDWNGVYVSDDQLHLRWCKPTDSFPGRNDTELQALTLSFIVKSQMYGFGMLLSLGIYLIVLHIGCCRSCNHCNCTCSNDEPESE